MNNVHQMYQVLNTDADKKKKNYKSSRSFLTCLHPLLHGTFLWLSDLIKSHFSEYLSPNCSGLASRTCHKDITEQTVCVPGLRVTVVKLLLVQRQKNLAPLCLHTNQLLSSSCLSTLPPPPSCHFTADSKNSSCHTCFLLYLLIIRSLCGLRFPIDLSQIPLSFLITAACPISGPHVITGATRHRQDM